MKQSQLLIFQTKEHRSTQCTFKYLNKKRNFFKEYFFKYLNKLDYLWSNLVLAKYWDFKNPV